MPGSVFAETPELRQQVESGSGVFLPGWTPQLAWRIAEPAGKGPREGALIGKADPKGNLPHRNLRSPGHQKMMGCKNTPFIQPPHGGGTDMAFEGGKKAAFGLDRNGSHIGNRDVFGQTRIRPVQNPAQPHRNSGFVVVAPAKGCHTALR